MNKIQAIRLIRESLLVMFPGTVAQGITTATEEPQTYQRHSALNDAKVIADKLEAEGLSFEPQAPRARITRANLVEYATLDAEAAKAAGRVLRLARLREQADKELTEATTKLVAIERLCD